MFLFFYHDMVHVIAMLCVYIVTMYTASLWGFTQDAQQCKKVSTARWDGIEDTLILECHIEDIVILNILECHSENILNMWNVTLKIY